MGHCDGDDMLGAHGWACCWRLQAQHTWCGKPPLASKLSTAPRKQKILVQSSNVLCGVCVLCQVKAVAQRICGIVCHLNYQFTSSRDCLAWELSGLQCCSAIRFESRLSCPLHLLIRHLQKDKNHCIFKLFVTWAGFLMLLAGIVVSTLCTNAMPSSLL